MKITLSNIVPVPLRDKPQLQQSQVWGRKAEFAGSEWVKIKAPSGTGKTTLLHIIWQLRSDFTGSVLYDGKNAAAIGADGIANYRQQKMSVIFQDLRLFGNLTARENIELKRSMAPPPFYEPAVIDDMAKQLGVQHVLNQKTATCSYGEQQRIAIIRALMQPFEMLLLDEPFSHLDNNNTAKAAALIAAECRKRNAGFVLTDLDDDNNFEYTQHLTL